ncbi:hypothetical protein HHK36_001150 [Tetracentron sinense]|uniref:Mitochondrial carrier protein n=1 Tax=Tetracentron sinense TaxID=13715 RepID=A0A834ZSB6_TETSI|nr:hypothetical protein HHK36_001150 [Tetracentron sinense]
MASHRQPSRGDQPLIKYRWTQHKVASFEPADSCHEEDVSTLFDTHKHCSKKSGPKSSELLSTSEFVSAVGQIWDCASRPLSFFLPKANLEHYNRDCQKENILCYSGGGKKGKASTADSKYFHVDMKSASCSPDMMNLNFEYLKVTQKISLFEPCGEHDRHSLFWRYLRGGTDMPEESWKGKGLASLGISFDLRNIYGWISEKPLLGLKNPVNVNQIEKETPSEICISRVATNSANKLEVESDDCNISFIKCKDYPLVGTAKFVENEWTSATSLYSEYSLRTIGNIVEDGAVSGTLSSSLYSDYYIAFLALGNCAFEKCQNKTEEGDIVENGKRQIKELVLEDEQKKEICPLLRDPPHYALAKQEHAFAGALAGTVVSLCLHPIDTFKTVIQSCQADQKSICHIGRLIIADRGVTGLYRGIVSNIASSAPISAVYTFTYESVKGALLPLFPKEYHSFAHCMAGGCASIATSFICTPSECIKQQMQVGSHYPNCWNAMVGIFESGGLPSLYAGWGAVVCRNVPHSIIKFYTYESLKQLMSSQSNARPNTLQTLVCGGLAGSTAALFTTPFDVVKTRLQTQMSGAKSLEPVSMYLKTRLLVAVSDELVTKQIPGSLRQYDGVFHALQQIAKHEGLKGLYRGLTPRLVMYISQGALFFASYELCKSLFSLGVPQLHAQTVQNKQNMEDDLTSLLSSPPPSSQSPKAAQVTFIMSQEHMSRVISSPKA